MLTFAMALTIPSNELPVCMRLARPGYEAISLTNDLYSWRKERIDAERAGQDYVFNAIWVIMKERGCSEGAAIEMCKHEIRRHIADFNANVERARSGDGNLSSDTVKYLEAVRLSHVGNLVWSIYCPRYHGTYVAPLVRPSAPSASQTRAARSLLLDRRVLTMSVQCCSPPPRRAAQHRAQAARARAGYAAHAFPSLRGLRPTAVVPAAADCAQEGALTPSELLLRNGSCISPQATVLLA